MTNKHDLSSPKQNNQNIGAQSTGHSIQTHHPYGASTASARALGNQALQNPPRIHQRAPVMIQRVPVSSDRIHRPIVEQFRRAHGLPESGRDESGARVGPSAGQIVHQLSYANQLARLQTATPWQLAQMTPQQREPTGIAPPNIRRRFADYDRAGRLAQAVFQRYGVNFDMDARPSRIVGREPNTEELAVIDRQLNRILDVRGVRTVLTGQGRGIPRTRESATPTMAGRVRITQDNIQFGYKLYQLHTSVLGLSHISDSSVEAMLRGFRLTMPAGGTVTRQERQVTAFNNTMVALSIVAGFYHTIDDKVYLNPRFSTGSAVDIEVVRHESVHFLGGRVTTRQAFVQRYGEAGWLRYWEPFEEGMAEIITRESAAADQPRPNYPGGAGYPQHEALMRRIMGDPRMGRRNLLRAYFTGVIPERLFTLLEQHLGSP